MSKKPKCALYDRLAVLHADGSVTVFTEDTTMEKAEAERREMDKTERRLSHLGRVARVRIEVLEQFEPVAAPVAPVCPTCRRPHS